MNRGRIIYWLVGTAAAFSGVFVVRVLALNLPDDRRIMISLLGYALAFMGLFIITIGTRRKR